MNGRAQRPGEGLEAKIRLEAKKRAVVIREIDEVLPLLASRNLNLAEESARKTLADIREGNNPDLEEKLREKAEELGIDLDN